MTLTGVGKGYVMGGVYMSPYVATIDGVSTYVICDDFTTDVWIDDTWEANQYSLSEVTPSGPQKFTTPDWSPYTIQEEYDAAALLAEDVMANMVQCDAGRRILLCNLDHLRPSRHQWIRRQFLDGFPAERGQQL